MYVHGGLQSSAAVRNRLDPVTSKGEAIWLCEVAWTHAIRWSPGGVGGSEIDAKGGGSTLERERSIPQVHLGEREACHLLLDVYAGGLDSGGDA